MCTFIYTHTVYCITHYYLASHCIVCADDACGGALEKWVEIGKCSATWSSLVPRCTRSGAEHNACARRKCDSDAWVCFYIVIFFHVFRRSASQQFMHGVAVRANSGIFFLRRFHRAAHVHFGNGLMWHWLNSRRHGRFCDHAHWLAYTGAQNCTRTFFAFVVTQKWQYDMGAQGRPNHG